MKNEHVLELPQLKALTHPMRLRLVESLADRPMTTKQVAEILDEDPLKLYYHMNVLEEVGLIEVVETQIKGNLVEKHYRSVARQFTAAIPLTHEAERAETVPEAIQGVLGAAETDARNACFASGLPIIASHQHIRTSREKTEQLTLRIQEMIEEVGLSDQGQDNRYSFTVLFIPLDEEEGEEHTGDAT